MGNSKDVPRSLGSHFLQQCEEVCSRSRHAHSRDRPFLSRAGEFRKSKERKPKAVFYFVSQITLVYCPLRKVYKQLLYGCDSTVRAL